MDPVAEAAPAAPAAAAGAAVAAGPEPVRYDRRAAEARHRARWLAEEPFRAEVDPGREKFTLFVAGPYASGSLHLGHVRSYTLADVCARYERARGRNVLFTIGFDTFGLPGEVAARSRGVHPAPWSARCVADMRVQLDRLGLSLDWRRSFTTSEDRICRRTQRMFTDLWRAGLAYRADAPVSWCDECRTSLAAHQAEGGACWRCGSRVRLRRLPQWFYRMTAIAGELSDRMERSDWDANLKSALRAWYGRQDGYLVRFRLAALDRDLDCFVPEAAVAEPPAFVAVRPDHPLVAELAAAGLAPGPDELLDLVTDADPAARRAGPAGWDTGLRATDPRGGGDVPLYVVDFLDGSRDLPAIVGVPGVDAGHRAFAEREGLAAAAAALADPAAAQAPATVYRIGDWLVSRQRFWGAPVPMVDCAACGWVPVPVADLPVRLPDEIDLDDPGNPLERPEFRDTACPGCGGPARRSTDTLDCMCELIWHYTAAASPHAGDDLFVRDELEHWLPVDCAFYGADVVRFTPNFEFLLAALARLGRTSVRYPFGDVVLHGLVLDESGRKMSKSAGTAVDVDDLLERHGADALRLYVVGAARPDRSFRWSESRLRDAGRVVTRLYRAACEVEALVAAPVPLDKRSLAPAERWEARVRQAVEQATRHMERRQYHRAAAAAIVLLDRLETAVERAGRGGEDPRVLLRVAAVVTALLAPFAPYVCAEIAARPGFREHAATLTRWPTA